MSIKKYGLYLFYPPTVNLRTEGLGRHLAELLKAAQESNDIQFVIACPSWGRQSLFDLCEANGICTKSLEVISPRYTPALLRAYEIFLQLKKQRNKKQGSLKRFLIRTFNAISKLSGGALRHLIYKLVSTRSPLLMAITGIIGIPFFAAGGLIYIISQTANFLCIVKKNGYPRVLRSKWFEEHFRRLQMLVTKPKEFTIVVKAYRLMERAETGILNSMIDDRKDILAWYTPTAFWPQFNEISGPRLMCVPDVVFADFPVGFAGIGGNRMLENFQQVEKSIKGCDFFVTYSQDIKWRTLVNRYNVDPDKVYVVPHGANQLDKQISVSGFSDNEAATDQFCRYLFRDALGKAANYNQTTSFCNEDVKFLFYASQFRPNKNLISLLRAYEFLLRQRHIGHKMILTGDPYVLSEVKNFITERRLENDVLCLRGLSEQELAACYRLADLAVNPSLSEGGFPFTFSEAVSVGTPVVMARISVTEEIIVDQDLGKLMLFDPYDWMDIASRIEWALKNKQILYQKQRLFFDDIITKRTWRQVVEEYISILNQIAQRSSKSIPVATKNDL